MMFRKPDETIAVSTNQRNALDLAANESASLKNEFENSPSSTEPIQTIQSVQTETINTFQTSTVDSTEFFQPNYYYIIKVRISLK